MVTHKRILEMYDQGPEAVVSLFIETLANLGARLQPVEEKLHEIALISPVTPCYEMGMRNEGKTEWIYTFSTKQVTL